MAIRKRSNAPPPLCFGIFPDDNRLSCGDCFFREKCGRIWSGLESFTTVREAAEAKAAEDEIPDCREVMDYLSSLLRKYGLRPFKVGARSSPKFRKALDSALLWAHGFGVDWKIYFEAQFVILSLSGYFIHKQGLDVHTVFGKGSVERYLKYRESEKWKAGSLEHLKEGTGDEVTPEVLEFLYAARYIEFREAGQGTRDAARRAERSVEEAEGLRGKSGWKRSLRLWGKEHENGSAAYRIGALRMLFQHMESIIPGLENRVVIKRPRWGWEDVYQFIRSEITKGTGNGRNETGGER